ncbi:MAG: amidohydrolase family protein [Negativicutes bacterium]|nr:amidohydrolase family protein [Negativicutes bacterium]
MKKPVIDFHVHLTEYEAFCESAYKWFIQAFPSPEDYRRLCEKYRDSGKFIELMDENGVDYSVILAEVAPLTTGIATNEAVKAFCQGQSRLIPFCTFNPYVDSGMGRKLEDLCVSHGFKGLKLYPTYNHFYPNDSALYPLYSVAEKYSIPVLFHTGSSIFKNSRIKYGNPISLDDVAVDFPELKIVMAHGGRGHWYPEAFTMVRLHENVYIDVAGLPPQKLLEFFPDMERYADKFIFGTDWPSVDVRKNIEKLSQLPISREAIEKILGMNAKKVLRIP